MQEKKDKAQEAKNAINKVLNSRTEEDFLQASIEAGKLLADEYNKREAATRAKAPHLKGLQAAKGFEDLVEECFEDVAHFEKFHDRVGDSVEYGTILPKVSISEKTFPGSMQRFIDILRASNGIDIGYEIENPQFAGMIYFDIGFPASVRV